MGKIDSRMAALSPERQKLLKQLLGRTTELAGREAAFTFEDDSAGSKMQCRAAYNDINLSLDATPFGAYSFFLNYGYVPDGSPSFARAEVPNAYFNRASVRLMLEVIADASIDGRDVLDVGCGRGGMVHVLCEFLSPAKVCAVDLSSAAIAFCRHAHKYPVAEFSEGDAERLSYPANSFDVVTNVESSSCYPNIFSFYREVFRVLRPGGRFLYTDCLPAGRMQEAIAYLSSLSFEIEQDRDITANVLLSCDQVAAARSAAYSAAQQGGELDNFLGAPGTPNYEYMRAGLRVYRILKVRKPEAYGWSA
jgi:ubiquinone/menaquinone biosynthesis C-methylase UbiE